MLEFDVLQSGLVILLLLALGDVLTHFTRGAVPVCPKTSSREASLLAIGEFKP